LDNAALENRSIRKILSSVQGVPFKVGK